MALDVGRPAPAFTLRDQARNEVSLDDLKGRNTLVVFIPFPFTGNCSSEVCELRDHLADLDALDANVVVISCDTVPVHAKWAADNGLSFPVLSDFWPHGDVARAYDTFNETLGCANRTTYVLDADGVIRAVVASDSLGTVREYDAYVAALEAISSPGGGAT